MEQSDKLLQLAPGLTSVPVKVNNQFGIASIAILVIVVFLLIGISTYYLIDWKNITDSQRQSKIVSTTQSTPTPILKSNSPQKVPRNYSECLVSDKRVINEYRPPDLICQYSVHYLSGETIDPESQKENKKIYEECAKVGGEVFTGHGDGPDVPLIYIHSCELIYYNPDFIWPRDYDDCANNKGEIEKSKDGNTKDLCYIRIDKEDEFKKATNKEIEDKLIRICLANGGEPLFSKYREGVLTGCYQFFEKTRL